MPLDFPLSTTTLDNGLRVVVSSDHSVPSVSINLWVEVGSGHERPGSTGLAHLFEHLMFQGSELVGEGEHMSLLMAQGGRANATTSFDRTAYVESVPTGALELALWLEADRHGHLLPALTQANLDNQRDVVVEEKRQRYDTVPYGEALAHACRLVFPEGHPYRHTPIGSMEDLLAATLEHTHDFFTAHYGPATSILTLVGDVEPADAFAMAQTYLGHLPTGLTAKRPEPAAPLGPMTEPAELDLVEDVPSERLYLCFRLPAVSDPDFLPCAMALDSLASLSVSRLHLRLLRRDESASGLSASALGLAQGSLGLLVADISEGRTLAEVEATIREELMDFARTGPDEAQLEASRADTERSWLEALAAFDERAELISRATALFGDPQRINTYLDQVMAVTAEQVRRAAEVWLQPSGMAPIRYRQEADR